MEENKKYIIKNCTYFNLPATLDCGQAFRWIPQGGGYFGVVGERAVHIRRQGKDIILTGCEETDYQSFWRHYFDMDFDYQKLIEEYSDDPYIKMGAAYADGQRLLRQPHFETLLSFILSANNNLRRIQGIIQRLCQAYGREIAPGVHAFPTAEGLKDVSEADYCRLGAGYRGKYLEKTVRMINDGFDLAAIEKLPYRQAKAGLMELSGVGGKVADCVLLYGYDFRNAFPFDVWVKRIVSALYFGGKGKQKEMEEFVAGRFGENAGVLQLFLFHYARHHRDSLDRAGAI